MSRSPSPLPLCSSRKACVCVFLSMLSCAAQSQDWKLDLAPSVVAGVYQGSLQRNRYTETGLTLSADDGKAWRLALGLGDTTVTQKNGAPSLTQQSAALSLSRYDALEALSGRFTTRLDVYRVNAKDAALNADNVNAVAPEVSWLSETGMLYLDTGYARSQYKNGMTIQQFTPTVGLGLNDGYDWLQLRGYQISGINPLLAAGRSSTSSADLSWTHYFAKPAAYMPASVTLGTMSGKRLYAVNRDAMSISNVADLQTGSVNLSANWRLGNTTYLTLLLAQSRFRNDALNNDYKLNVAYAKVNFGF